MDRASGYWLWKVVRYAPKEVIPYLKISSLTVPRRCGWMGLIDALTCFDLLQECSFFARWDPRLPRYVLEASQVQANGIYGLWNQVCPWSGTFAKGGHLDLSFKALAEAPALKTEVIRLTTNNGVELSGLVRCLLATTQNRTTVYLRFYSCTVDPTGECYTS